MSQFASTGPEASSSEPSLLLEQPGFEMSDVFEFEDLEMEEETPPENGFTIPLGLQETRFEITIPQLYQFSQPLHRRIIELRTGTSSKPSQNRKQKIKVKEVRWKKDRNSTRLSPLSQPFSIHRDTLSEGDGQVSVPLFVPNLEAFTCLNNPHSKPQSWTTHSVQGSKPNSNSHLTLNSSSSSSITLGVSSPNFGDHSQRTSCQSSKRRNEGESNGKRSHKRRRRSSQTFNYQNILNGFQTSATNSISALFTFRPNDSLQSIDLNSEDSGQSTSCSMINWS